MTDVQPHIAVHALQAHVAAVGGEFQIACDVGDFVVAVVAAGLYRNAARHSHFQIVGNLLVVGRVILVGADQQTVAFRHNLDGRVAVGAVGVAAGNTRARFYGRSPLTSGRVGAGHLDIAARVFEYDPLGVPRAARWPPPDSRRTSPTS